jgi:hypothetical protein
MDTTREALARADRHIIESRQRIAKQQALVNQLERDGHDITMAKALLKEFRRSLRLHLAGRATLEAELAAAGLDPAVTISTISAAILDPDQAGPGKPAQRDDRS